MKTMANCYPYCDKAGGWLNAITFCREAAISTWVSKTTTVREMTTARLREGLNVESGLNDGICVPIVLFFVALAGSGGHGDDSASALALLVQEIGIGPAFHLFSWQVVLYALLSLTVIRVVPIFLSLTGTGESVPSKLFLGWFGPRGLASIVFAIIVINAEVPGAEFLALVVTCTVFLSLVAHGMSANPLAKWIGTKDQQDA